MTSSILFLVGALVLGFLLVLRILNIREKRRYAREAAAFETELNNALHYRKEPLPRSPDGRSGIVHFSDAENVGDVYLGSQRSPESLRSWNSNNAREFVDELLARGFGLDEIIRHFYPTGQEELLEEAIARKRKRELYENY